MALQSTAIVAKERVGVPLSLVAVSLEFRGIREGAASLPQLEQMIFSGFDLIDVAEHATDFLPESLPVAEHGLGCNHAPTSVLIQEVVLEKGLGPSEGFSPKVGRGLQSIALSGGKLVVIKVLIQFDL